MPTPSSDVFTHTSSRNSRIFLCQSTAPSSDCAMDFVGSQLSDMDLMLFHHMERAVFTRLTQSHGRDHERTKSVLGLWMWFESIGHHDFIRHLYSYPDEVVLQFAREAELCIDTLANPSLINTEHNHELPLTAKQLNEPMELKFFAFNREVVINGIRIIVESICDIIFEESRQEEARMVSERAGESLRDRLRDLLKIEHEASASGKSAGVVAEPTLDLNPMASPWSPAIGQTLDDHRSMFITFSKGHPISREDISEFFNTRYGSCVEAVMIERAAPHLPPMYGRVVFSSASMIAMVLNGQRTAKFMIKGKHLWARMYVPRRSGGHFS